MEGDGWKWRNQGETEFIVRTLILPYFKFIGVFNKKKKQPKL